VASFGVLSAGAAVGAGTIANVLSRLFGRASGLGTQLAVVGAASIWLIVGGFSNREELEQRARFYERRQERRSALATWIRENTKENDLVLLGDAGIIPYETPNPYRDPFCLNEAAFTSSPIASDPVQYASHIFESEKPKVLILNSNAMKPGMLHGTSHELAQHPRLESDYKFVGNWPRDCTSTSITSDAGQYASPIFESEKPKVLTVNSNAMKPGMLHGTSHQLAQHPRLESDYTCVGNWPLDGGITYFVFLRRDDGSV